MTIFQDKLLFKRFSQRSIHVFLTFLILATKLKQFSDIRIIREVTNIEGILIHFHEHTAENEPSGVKSKHRHFFIRIYLNAASLLSFNLKFQKMSP